MKNLTAQPFSQSEIVMWDECPTKWYNKYVLLLEKVGEYQLSLLIGTAWHTMIENWYRSKGKALEAPELEYPEDVIITQEMEKEQEMWHEILEAMIQAYAYHFEKDLTLFKPDTFEETATVTIEIDKVEIQLTGKIDMTGKFRNKIAQWDHKTTSQLTPQIVDAWEYKFQFMFYAWLKKQAGLKVEEFIVNAVRKPQLRQNKGEHIHTFAGRVKHAMLAEPDKYFYRQHLPTTDFAFQNFEESVLMPKLQRIASLQKNPKLASFIALNRNTEACNHFGQVCPFYDKCFHGETKQYRTREIKHVELE